MADRRQRAEDDWTTEECRLDEDPTSPWSDPIVESAWSWQPPRFRPVPLTPAPITVHPNPRLVVEYFHQRDEFSDDALTPEIEQALVEQARRLGTTPESLALDAIRERLAATKRDAPVAPISQAEWEARLRGVGTDCGVSLSHEAVSREGLYE